MKHSRSLRTPLLALAAFAACSHDAKVSDDLTGPSFGVLAPPAPSPIVVKGTPSCAEVNANNAEFPSITSNFGFLITKLSTGQYTVRMIDSLPYTQMTGGAPQYYDGKVSINVVKYPTFDWSATLGMDAVIVKVKDSSFVYVYSPEAKGGSSLRSPALSEAIAVEFCHDYELAATKTAIASYTGTYAWAISKAVDDDSLEGSPRASVTANYTVAIDQTVTESDFLVSGQILVTNPTPWGPVPFSIRDTVGSTSTKVTCDRYTLDAGATATCLYEAGLTGKVNGTNTATITSGSDTVGGTTASKSYVFPTVPTKSIGYPFVKVSDSFKGFLGSTSVDTTFSYARTFPTCSSRAADYSDGVDQHTYANTATILATKQADTASVTVTCKAGFVDVLKLTQGVVNPDIEWGFVLYLGPDGFGSNKIGGSSTYGDGDGILEFGGPALDTTKTYTVCERQIPAGYTSRWNVDVEGDGTFDATVIPYNPNANDVPPDDLGNRCVDFGAGTTIPLTVGTTIRFRVDNTYPGGDPRSSGYWKNWNICTAGGQAAGAERNGGYENGFYLLEDVLDPSIGGGIVWDDIQSDEKLVTIASCQQAVALLDQRVVTESGKGKKLANDAARTLAMQLLAAQLNLGAGACTGGGTVRDALLAAEVLLDKIDFDGTTTSAYLTPKSGADYSEALRLAAILGEYNNGLYCGSLR